MSDRDFQRRRVYNAEDTVPHGRGLPTMDDLERYVATITSTPWFVERWGVRTIRVKDGRGRRSAYGSSAGHIAMPRWCRNELIVCHEVAHVLVGSGIGRGGAHGQAFCGVYYFLVGQMMGDEARIALGNAFYDFNVAVDFTAARTPRLQAAKERAR